MSNTYAPKSFLTNIKSFSITLSGRIFLALYLLTLYGHLTLAYGQTEDAPAASTLSKLHQVVNARSSKERLRDMARHPIQTLNFFGIEDDMTVVELLPGGGWYSKILAPYLNERGQLYAAHVHPKSKRPSRKYVRRSLRKYKKWHARNPNTSNMRITAIAKDHYEIAPQGSADMVLTFRSAHNWVRYGYFEYVVRAAHQALKPNGIFGVVGHRASSKLGGATSKEQARTGYISEDYVIETVTQNGFKLLARSEINANPKDTADHARGVWSLPPTLRGTRKRADSDPERKKYMAIGESDRFTLKFIKI